MKMNKEQIYLARRLKATCEKKLEGLEDRRIAAQQEEDEDAELMGRTARLIKIEPLVEVPTPLLAAILDEIGDETTPETDESVRAYRRHCKVVQGLGSTNPVAAQLLAVINLVKLPPEEKPVAEAKKSPKEDVSAKV